MTQVMFIAEKMRVIHVVDTKFEGGNTRRRDSNLPPLSPWNLLLKHQANTRNYPRNN